MIPHPPAGCCTDSATRDTRAWDDCPLAGSVVAQEPAWRGWVSLGLIVIVMVCTISAMSTCKGACQQPIPCDCPRIKSSVPAYPVGGNNVADYLEAAALGGLHGV